MGVFRSQLIWIYTVCKGRIYPGSVGQELKYKWCWTHNSSHYAFTHSEKGLRCPVTELKGYRSMFRWMGTTLEHSLFAYCIMFLFRRWVQNMAIKFNSITKTRLYNFDPLKPHCYILKLGFTGVYIIFLISAQNIDCGYSLESPRRGGSNEYPQSMFWAEMWKISEFFIWTFSFFGGEIINSFE